jgi:hypothetical protein
MEVVYNLNDSKSALPFADWKSGVAPAENTGGGRRGICCAVTLIWLSRCVTITN